MALLLVVAWNVRRLSVRETNRSRMRWEMVLLTELKADEKGVVWLGEDEERGGADPREEGGSDVKEKSTGKVGRGGTTEVVWGECGSCGCGGTKISVWVPAKLRGLMGTVWRDADLTLKGR